MFVWFNTIFVLLSGWIGGAFAVSLRLLDASNALTDVPSLQPVSVAKSQGGRSVGAAELNVLSPQSAKDANVAAPALSTGRLQGVANIHSAVGPSFVLDQPANSKQGGPISTPPAAAAPETDVLQQFIDANKPKFPYHTGIELTKNPDTMPTCLSITNSVPPSGRIFLINLLAEFEKDAPGAKDTCDAFKSLASAVLEHDARVQDNPNGVHVVESLMQCIANEKNQWTIVQAIWRHGLKDCFEHPFFDTLYLGNQEYNPSLSKDKFGNNLIHLVAMANQESLLGALHSKELSLREGTTQDNVYSYLWAFALMEDTNDEGKKPLQVVPDNSIPVAAAFKGFFRQVCKYLQHMTQRAEQQEVAQQAQQTDIAQQAEPVALQPSASATTGDLTVPPSPAAMAPSAVAFAA